MNAIALFILATFLLATVLCRPQHGDDFDYRLFEDDNSGVAIDKVLEAPRSKYSHHHHSHHKKYLKTNRLEKLKRMLRF
ncbi:hypothetical protein WR25_18894 [Diploscapter pachys]|uniref:Uncharacterized protein n=1 Tax=Diploscapter pachys TaxID=2018661 RepID=A0A2A2KH45_9BILA|nr:hypothetical protein WR25_18894 [Diploscapter pachys]